MEKKLLYPVQIDDDFIITTRIPQAWRDGVRVIITPLNRKRARIRAKQEFDETETKRVLEAQKEEERIWRPSCTLSFFCSKKSSEEEHARFRKSLESGVFTKKQLAKWGFLSEEEIEKYGTGSLEAKQGMFSDSLCILDYFSGFRVFATFKDQGKTEEVFRRLEPVLNKLPLKYFDRKTHGEGS